MSGQSGENQGLGDAHPPEKNSALAAKIGSGKASVEAAMADLVGGLNVADEDGQPSLMLDEIDEQMALFGGPVKHVANQIASARRRGRPKGSPNKNAFRDVLLRMGYRHPGLNLAAIANATPEGLARELLCERGEAMGFILKANAELMPFFESKRPNEIEVTTKALGVMIIGEMKTEGGPKVGVIDLANVEEQS